MTSSTISLLFLKNITTFLVCVAECEKRGHVFNHQHRLCFDLFTTTLQWNQSREACQDIGGQLVTLDSVSKINFMSDYISYICKCSCDLVHVHIG